MDIKDIRDAKVTHAGLLQHNSDGTTELQKITHAGLIARSPEGTAAKGMNIRGNEDLWVEIQANTFRNWVNEHLRDSGMQVNDWITDFCDGTHLCALVENLQKRPLKPSWNRRPANQHHFLENATVALNAIEKDGIKLVNIGNVDIVNGNIKLILGLIWSLIVRYQIGRSKFPPRKLMLAWLQAALPECKITNLTTDWNSGVNLSALLDYCEPGLFPHWRNLDKNQSIRNCTTAMNMAQREFNIPKVLEPEYLASPWLDELSGMTYLSYFMKPGGPGYNATMRWVNTQLKSSVTNFTTDWNDGKVFCEVIKGLGGSAPDPTKLSTHASNWESNIKKAVDAGERLGVKPILTPKDMANPEVEHLGIMAYAAHLQWIPKRPPLSQMLAVHLESTSGRVGETTYFRVEILSRDIEMSSVRAYIVPPTGVPQQVKLNRNGEGSFVPEKYGMHEIVLEVGEDKLPGHYFRVLPRLIQVAPPGMAPCSLGSLVEVLVNATGAPKSEDILVTAYSPTGRSLKCPLKNGEEGHSAIFKPDEAGIWEIAITYQGRHIQGGPFTCAVFDPNGVSVHGLDGAMPLRAHSFEIDARGVGVSGELHVDIVHEKRSLVCSIEKLVENKYRVTFMPRQNGKYRVYIYFNGYDVKGSPYIMRVGTKGKSGKTRSSVQHDTNKLRSESPQTMHYTSNNSASTKHNDFRSAKRDMYEANNSRSYSPQYSPKGEEPYKINRDTEVYSPQLLHSPKRDDYSAATNKFGSDLYSTSTKTETRKLVNNNNNNSSGDYQSSSTNFDYNYGNKENSTPPRNEKYTSSYVSKNYSDNYSSKQKNDSFTPIASPIRTTSPVIRNSPLTVTTTTTTSRYETSRNLSGSPRNFSSSPSPRHETASPSNYITSSTHRISSPITVSTTHRLSTSSPVQKTNIRRTASPEPIDHSSNIRVSTLKNGAARRDSWDVINKTKHLLSPNSLESLANLTESQLNTDLSYNRPKEFDTETERNTQYNRYTTTLNEKEKLEPRRSFDETDRYKIYTPSTYVSMKHSDTNLLGGNTSSNSRNFSTTIKEKTERSFITSEKNNNSISSSNNATTEYLSSGFRPIDKQLMTGAKAIIVQDIPNGVLGRPVEFEIDGSRAGSGNLEILVNGGRVTSSVRSLGSQKFVASFISHEAGMHTVQITFNGDTVPGKRFSLITFKEPN